MGARSGTLKLILLRVLEMKVCVVTLSLIGVWPLVWSTRSRHSLIRSFEVHADVWWMCRPHNSSSVIMTRCFALLLHFYWIDIHFCWSGVGLTFFQYFFQSFFNLFSCFAFATDQSVCIMYSAAGH